MRQIGVIDREHDAQRFAAYLVTQGVSAHAEQEDGVWVIWVRDENDLDKAKQAIDQFQAAPSDPRYAKAERAAETIRREQAEKRQQAQKNVIEMRGRWGTGAGRKAPLTFVLIGLSILATIWTGFGGKTKNFAYLSFRDVTQRAPDAPEADLFSAPFVDIRHGQVWRLVTPIFVHLSPMHLIFNMYWTYVFGAMIEDRRGTLRFAGLVLVIAVLSTLAQAVIETANFGGMSGVSYGLFGYAWMKTIHEPRSGIVLSRSLIIMFMIFFAACFTGWIGPIANTAHAVGLGVGIIVGYLPVLLGGEARK